MAFLILLLSSKSTEVVTSRHASYPSRVGTLHWYIRGMRQTRALGERDAHTSRTAVALEIAATDARIRIQTFPCFVDNFVRCQIPEQSARDRNRNGRCSHCVRRGNGHRRRRRGVCVVVVLGRCPRALPVKRGSCSSRKLRYGNVAIRPRVAEWSRVALVIYVVVG